MKHWMFGALLLSTVVLTACGTDKTTQLSFEEAANLSMYDSNVISQLLLGSDSPYQQDFSLTTQFQWEGGKASLDLSSQTQQDKKAEKAQGTLAFDAQLLAGEETLGASGEISTFVTPQELFLKVQTLHLTGNDPVLAMASLVVQGIQGQWLRLPSSGEQSLFAGTKDYVSTLTTLQTNRDLLIQQ
ncbi:MAG: hypothetical protein LBD75_05940 [Candidatus Peribacteria bacterium]|jgi:hypothetical protein|nr:hypothetical protein [Candidatus Peribacteria bacterium]